MGWLTFHVGKFELLAGELRSFQSSAGVTRKFCGVCGSPITYENDRDPETIDVTTASLDSPDRFPPVREVWVEHKLTWEVTNKSLDQFPTSSEEP